LGSLYKLLISSTSIAGEGETEAETEGETDGEADGERDELGTRESLISNPITPQGSSAVAIVPPVTVPGLAVGVHV
jgi:hypothetical protein